MTTAPYIKQAIAETRDHANQLRDIDDRLTDARLKRCIEQMERALSDAAELVERGHDHAAYLTMMGVTEVTLNALRDSVKENA